MHPGHAAFYARTLAHLQGCRVVPEAAQLADWIQLQPWRDPPRELSVYIERLRRWPPGQPYPPIPDDEALTRGTDAQPGWWTPGATAPRATA